MTMHLLLPFPDPTDPVWPALDRYLAGQATADDLVEVARWESGEVTRKDAIRQWKSAWTQMTVVSVQSDADVRRRAWEIIDGTVANTGNVKGLSETRSNTHVSWGEPRGSQVWVRAARRESVGFGTRTLQKGVTRLGSRSLNAETDFSRDVVTRAAHALVAARIGVFPGSAAEQSAGSRSSRMWQGKGGNTGTRVFRNVVFVGGAIAALVLMFAFGARTSRHVSQSKTYVTAAGQQATLTLSDGSRVVLSPRTTFRLVDFGGRARTVAVDGEAYFDVVRANDVPFVVRSGGVTTRVLGTSFLIRHMAGNARVHVAVENGKVLVTTFSGVNSRVTLTAGQIGDVMDSTVGIRKDADVPSDAEWMSGQLVFRDKPVAVILRTLSRWYGYQFRYTDYTLAQRNVTIGISTQSSAEALAEVERVLEVNLTVVGDTVTLVPLPLSPIHGTPRTRTYDVWTPTREVGR